MLDGQWEHLRTAIGVKYNCGHCGVLTSPVGHYYCLDNLNAITIANVFICNNCNKPTYMTDEEQVPGPIAGKDVKNLPHQVRDLYDEARKCLTVGAFTSSVLACRKILMNVSVAEGAQPNLRFVEYVNFLENGNYLPPNGRVWVDQIRQRGNDATHEISPMSKEDALLLISFTEMLLLFIYEFATPPQTTNP